MNKTEWCSSKNNSLDNLLMQYNIFRVKYKFRWKKKWWWWWGLNNLFWWSWSTFSNSIFCFFLMSHSILLTNVTLFYHVCWALIHLAGKLSIRHVELRKRVTRRQRHLREICWKKCDRGWLNTPKNHGRYLKSKRKRCLLLWEETERACAILYRPDSKRKWSFSDRWDFSWWFRRHCSTDRRPFRCNPRGSQYIPRRNVSIGIHKQGRGHLLIQVNFIHKTNPVPNQSINRSNEQTLHAHYRIINQSIKLRGQ